MNQDKKRKKLPAILLLALLAGWGLSEFYRLPTVKTVREAFATTEIEVSAIWYADIDAYRDIRGKKTQTP